MGEVVVVGSLITSCSRRSLPLLRRGLQFSNGGEYCWKGKQRLSPLKRQSRRNKLLMIESKTQSPRLITIKNQMEKRSATYSSEIATDMPLYESSPTASFDQYLEDKTRVVEAIFPDKRRNQRLDEEEWRIQMLPIQFLFLTVWPVIDMRVTWKSQGIDYPPGVPLGITKVIELHIIRWELQGLDNLLKPSEFTLSVKGALYPDRRGMCSRLRFQLQMSISFLLPPALAMVPEDVLRGLAESVLKGLGENMKHKVNRGLLADYSDFKREKLRTLV